MSTRQTGNRHENAFCEMAEALGYAAFPARGSRGPVDVICFQTWRGRAESLDALWRPPLAVQVGTTNKPILKTLSELEASPRPIGSRVLVARRHRMKNRRIRWTFHTLAGKYDSLEDAIR